MADANNAGDNLSAGSVTEAVTKPYRELTVAAVLLGIAQGITLNLAFVYVALKLGMGIGGSTVAAIMGYALLRGVLRTGTMVENNINQTIASGINTAGSGIVFTVPALYLIDPNLVHFLPLSIAGIAGAVLGVVVIIPLRKQMIEMDRLRFPSGVATATIIRAGSAGREKVKLLAWGIGVSVVWKLILISGVLASEESIAASGFGIGGGDGDELHYGMNFLPEYIMPIVSLSLMNIAAGMLAGRGGLPFFAGGLLSWWVIAPIAVNSGWMPPDVKPAGYVGVLYYDMLKPLGIGTLIGGALMGVVMAFPAIKSAFRSLAAATRSGASGSKVGGDELTLKPLICGTLLGVGLLFTAALLSPGVGIGGAIISAVVGTVWAALAALIVAQAAGMTDIQPMSGMSLISVTLMLVLLGGNAPGAMVVGVAVCVAIGQGADMMQDLKTGFLVGARPYRQQIAQFGVTWLGALLALWAVDLLWHAKASVEPVAAVAVAYDSESNDAAPIVASEEDGATGEKEADTSDNSTSKDAASKGGFGAGTKLPAPQGEALAGIIKSLSADDGGTSIPIDKYAMGGIVGLLLGTAPMAGLGVLVGLAMYLPISITMGYGCGCLLQMVIQKVKGVSFCEHRLVPLAAGLIVGEALTGMGHAMFSVFFPSG